MDSFKKDEELMEVEQILCTTIEKVCATFSATPHQTASTHSDTQEASFITHSDTQEKEEEDEEELLTFADMLNEDKRQHETARILFGCQDEKVCTFPEGYKTRQPLFSCLTCTPLPNLAGVCFGCSLHCHSGHQLIELYTKRRFRCDCGNSKFGGVKCSLYEDKSAVNDRNVYNQNFEGYFCTKKCVYPDPDNTEDMYQCVLCEDWYHLSHIQSEAVSDTDPDFICKGCVTKSPWLTALRENDSSLCCISSHSLNPSQQLTSIFLPSESWRKKICKCGGCESLLDSCGLDYLHDPEDLMSIYEAESIARTKDEDEEDDQSVATMISKEVGPEAAIHIMQGFNALKRDLSTFLDGMAAKGEVITQEDVKTFFGNMKKPRLE